MKERRAEIKFSPVSRKHYVQIYGPSGRKAGDPIDITSQFWGSVVQRLEECPNGLRITETIPVAADDSVCVGPDGSQVVKVKMRGTVTKVHTIKIVSVELRPSDEPTPPTPTQEPAKSIPSHG